MFEIIARWILNALALYLVSQIVDGFVISNFTTALIASLAISLLNLVIKPILLLLTLPINIVTFGLFTFIINAIILSITSGLIKGFEIHGFGTAILGAILISVISSLLHSLVRDN